VYAVQVEAVLREKVSGNRFPEKRGYAGHVQEMPDWTCRDNQLLLAPSLRLILLITPFPRHVAAGKRFDWLYYYD